MRGEAEDDAMGEDEEDKMEGMDMKDEEGVDTADGRMPEEEEEEAVVAEEEGLLDLLPEPELELPEVRAESMGDAFRSGVSARSPSLPPTDCFSFVTRRLSMMLLSLDSLLLQGDQ
nr:hypothetical protein BaRGS_000404 [Batillaria attramentaria]